MGRAWHILILAVTLLFMVSGCTVQTAADGATASLADQLQTFIGDFARQGLAAWLL